MRPNNVEMAVEFWEEKEEQESFQKEQESFRNKSNQKKTTTIPIYQDDGIANQSTTGTGTGTRMFLPGVTLPVAVRQWGILNIQPSPCNAYPQLIT